MKGKNVAIGLGLTIAAQFLVLNGMLAKSAMPLWTGTEIKVKTVPVDPRSLFRGNYARLNYDISLLPEHVLQEHHRVRIGEVVYVILAPTDDGLYEAVDATLERPSEGIFLRGRISRGYAPYLVKYGIEAFFAPKEKALKLEKDLRNGGVAILKVRSNGQVALSDVIANE